MQAGETISLRQKTRLVLVRHAHCEMAGRFCGGGSDPALSDVGRRQLPTLASELAEFQFTQIFSSDLLRCSQTAAALMPRPAFDAPSITRIAMPALRELSFGCWEGLRWSEIEARDPELARRWMDEYPLLPTPQGENFAAFQVRVRQALESIVQCMHGGTTAVVTHAGVIRVAMLDVLGFDEADLGRLGCDYAGWVELQAADVAGKLPSLAGWTMGDARGFRLS